MPMNTLKYKDKRLWHISKQSNMVFVKKKNGTGDGVNQRRSQTITSMESNESIYKSKTSGGGGTATSKAVAKLFGGGGGSQASLMRQ